MSRGALPFLFLLAACSFSSPDGSGDDGDGDGGDGSTDPDGDGVLGEDNCPNVANADQRDTDTDAVGDLCDNCPDVNNPPKMTMGHAAAIQRDHDGDGRGDACDLCPHLGGATPETDGDNDGSGDACDPEPTMPNPAPYWNGFYDPPDGSWESPSGGDGGATADWQLAARGDKLGWRQKVLDDTRHQLLLTTNFLEHHVQSSIIGDQLMANADRSSATIAYGYGRVSSGDEVWYSCGPRHLKATNTDVILAVVQREDTDETINAASWSGGFLDTTIDVTGRGDRVGSSEPQKGSSAVRCSGSAGTTRVETMFNTGYTPDGRVGLHTYAMTAWFDYVFIVEPRPRP